MAALISLAAQKPGQVMAMITPHGKSERYSVRFFGMDGKVEWVSVTPDFQYAVAWRQKAGDQPTPKSARQLPNPTVRYAQPGADSNEHQLEIWPMLIEKAYAAWGGKDYAGIEGGGADAVFRALTGRKAEHATVSGDGAKAMETWTNLTAWLKAGRPVVADCPYGPGQRHAFAVLSVTGKDWKSGTVITKNPHHRNPDPPRPFTTFVKQFDLVRVGYLPGAAS